MFLLISTLLLLSPSPLSFFLIDKELYLIRNGTRRKCDRMLGLTRVRRKSGVAGRKACGGMLWANGRDIAPPSIPRSLQQISTDKFLPCLEPSVVSSSVHTSLKFPRVPSLTLTKHPARAFSLLQGSTDWET